MKKSVNLWLLAAAAAGIMVTTAACGSKENEMPQMESVMTEMPAADTAETGTSETGNSMTVEEWAASEEAVTFVKAFNSVYAEQGITMELEAEDSTLSMVLIYSKEALETETDLTDEQKEEVRAMMQQQYDEIKEQLISKGNVLKEEVGASTIHIAYRTNNGTELFSQDL